MIRIAIPKTATLGEVIEIKAMIRHPMESGYRRNEMGRTIPRDIISSFVCRFESQPVFRTAWGPGVAANPLLTFHARVNRAGTFYFEWQDLEGQVFKAERAIEISP